MKKIPMSLAALCMMAALSAAEPEKITESDVWHKLDFPREVVPGSILDFSKVVLDAPAGKYGYAVIDKEGRLVFEKRPGVPLRLMGVNMSFGANFPEHELADVVAKRFAAYGINTVRFHHIDCVFADGSRGTDFIPEVMDKMDYFFAALKKQGIYVVSDFASCRTIWGCEGVKDAIPIEYGKAMVILHKGARDNQKDYIRHWLTHVNPYTGIAWKDDPAFVCATVCNENNFECWLSNRKNFKPLNDAFEKAFADFRKTHGNGVSEQVLFNRFVVAAHKEYFEDMKKFVHSLGTKLPLTDRNMWNDSFDTYCRTFYDYADDHFYVDHPTGQTPYRLQNLTTLPDWGGPLAELAAGRLLDRPYFVTEYNWVFPNDYRAESGVLTGAYAAMQGWNGLYRYTYAHPIQSVQEQGGMCDFDTNSDPINLFSDRIGALIYTRGDIKEAAETVSLAVTQADADSKKSYPLNIRALSLVCKTGSLPSGKKAMLGMPGCAQKGELSLDDPEFFSKLAEKNSFGKGQISIEKKLAVSSTGELEMDGINQTFRVVTPKSEVLLRNTPGTLKGKLFSVETAYMNSVLCAAAMDDKPLAESKRVIIFHLTDAQNSNTVFADKTHTVLLERGSMPILARYGKAEIRLAANGGKYTVKAVALNGSVIGEIPSKIENGVLCFTADNFAIPGTVVLAYELTGK